MGVPSHHPTLWDLALRPTDKKGNKYFLYKHTHTHTPLHLHLQLPTYTYGRRVFVLWQKTVRPSDVGTDPRGPTRRTHIRLHPGGVSSPGDVKASEWQSEMARQKQQANYIISVYLAG